MSWYSLPNPRDGESSVMLISQEVIVPKEIVRSSTDSPFHAAVGWTGNGNQVSLGVTLQNDNSIFDVLFGSEAVERLGEQIRKMKTESRGDDLSAGQYIISILNTVGFYQGLYSDLDRKGCNDLIRILRRARDSAFGKDE